MKKSLPLSYVELSKSNLIHNAKTLKSVMGHGIKLVASVKSNAYGHGQNEVVKILEPYVDYFFVNSVEEFVLLRTVSRKPTFILGYVQDSDLTKVMKHNSILTFFSIRHLQEINKIAEKLKVRQEVHMPIDAHLGREGFLDSKWSEVLTKIKKLKNIKLGGIYAHFANIEDVNNFTHAEKQINKYAQVLKLAGEFRFKNLQTHISATSGLMVYEEDKGMNSLIRIGIGLYGLWPSEHIKFLYKNKLELKPVLSWKTKVAQVKTLPAGSTVGYGLTHMTYETTKIAVIPQGYADGLVRDLSSKGSVLIKGQKCPILGRISMNMCVADVTPLRGVQEGDEVVIIGTQGRERITAEEVANLSGTINYEVTTRISALLHRCIAS